MYSSIQIWNVTFTRLCGWRKIIWYGGRGNGPFAAYVKRAAPFATCFLKTLVYSRLLMCFKDADVGECMAERVKASCKVTLTLFSIRQHPHARPARGDSRNSLWELSCWEAGHWWRSTTCQTTHKVSKAMNMLVSAWLLGILSTIHSYRFVICSLYI